MVTTTLEWFTLEEKRPTGRERYLVKLRVPYYKARPQTEEDRAAARVHYDVAWWGVREGESFPTGFIGTFSGRPHFSSEVVAWAALP